MLRSFRFIITAALALFIVSPCFAQQSAMPSFKPSLLPSFGGAAAPGILGNFYIAAGMGYGGAGRQFSLTDGFACPGSNQNGALAVLMGGKNGCSTQAQGYGFAMHGLVGYTLPGWIGISGIELRGRYGQEVVAGALGGSVALAPNSMSVATGQYSTTINGGLAVSGRMGANIGGIIPFVRAGIGVVHLSESLNFDGSQARVCATCNFGGKISFTADQWSPSGVIGAGLEVPVGGFFLRAEGELEAIFHPGNKFALMLAQNGIGGNLNTLGQASFQKENWMFAHRFMLSAGMRF